MPSREWKLRVRDIIDAAKEIRQFTSGTRFEDFVADRKTFLSVMHLFTIIGEAATHIPEDIKARLPEVVE